MKDNKFPEKEELVVATVENTTRFGAYLKLEDYALTAFLPISEISTRWIRRVTDVIREGQKVVVKVIRVDKKTKSIDVSLKEVSSSESKKVLAEWERNKKGEKLIKLFSERSNIEYDEIYNKIYPIISKSSTIYEALERIVIEPSVLERTNLPVELRETLYRFLINRIKPKEYALRAVVLVSHKGREGVHRIKKFFEKMEKNAKKKDLKIKISLIASPKYLVRISSYKPEQIKKRATELIDTASKYANQFDVNYQVIEKSLEK